VGDRVSDLMLRVTTIHASSAANTASYYTQYLTAAPGEVPGVWCGRQATALGLSGTVAVEPLELLLSGRDPMSTAPLGRELVDRVTRDGRVIKAVSGFDATFSAPKSLSMWWGLTGDRRLLEAHDVAVAAVLEHLGRFGSTTRIRRNGGRLHPDTQGLTIAVFRQTTSRADDPQIHTHAVISAKVQTDDGHWWALDARYLKRHQRMLGGLYQSVLRSELRHRFGVAWGPIVNGQAEIAGMPKELLSVFSKRAAAIDVAVAAKVDVFRHRHGCEPSQSQRAAMTREAAADTRGHKSGHGAAELVTRWRREAAGAGWTIEQLVAGIEVAAHQPTPAVALTVGGVVAAVSAQHSSWGRPDVLQAICDSQRPLSQMSGRRWLDTLERGADRVLERCVDLDPPDATRRRMSDGRSLWIEPTAPRFTSEAVLAEEEHILTWAIDTQSEPAAPAATVNDDELDVLQAEAAASVAGTDRLVLVVGPAGAGKTRMLAAAVADLHVHGQAVFGVAPTAKAARVLERDTGMRADTAAKLLHEWQRPDRPPRPEYQLPPGTTVVIDEAGMLSTPALHHLVVLAEAQRWRLVLVGDHRQLQAVGRGGLFAELCANGRVDGLERLHRFTHEWEADASLLLRSGDARALDAYQAHDRIIPGSIDAHLQRMATRWIEHHQRGDTVALVASTNDHVDAINSVVQAARLDAGHLDSEHAVPIAGGEQVHLGDVVATRRNERTLITSSGEPVRNRETWTVTAITIDGSLTVSRQRGHGTVTLPADYVREHVRLGYAATEHGYQSDTVDHSLALTSAAASRRGLYVAATRGRDDNVLCVLTDSDEVAQARDVLDGILASTAPTSPPPPNAAHSPNRQAAANPTPPDPYHGARPRTGSSHYVSRSAPTWPLRKPATRNSPPNISDSTTPSSPLNANCATSRKRRAGIATALPPPNDGLTKRAAIVQQQNGDSTTARSFSVATHAATLPPPTMRSGGPITNSPKHEREQARTSSDTTRRQRHRTTPAPPWTSTVSTHVESTTRQPRSSICSSGALHSTPGVDGPPAPPLTSTKLAQSSTRCSPPLVPTPTTAERSVRSCCTGQIGRASGFQASNRRARRGRSLPISAADASPTGSASP
jgi:conjugative relaxase-like TrwC/TraI family protein